MTRRVMLAGRRSYSPGRVPLRLGLEAPDRLWLACRSGPAWQLRVVENGPGGALMPRRVLLLTLTVALTVALSLAAYVPASSAPRRASPLDKLNPALLSQGARRWLTGPPERPGVRARSVPRFGSNLDVNDPARDLAGGQSETAIAAGGRRVLAAWNDVTGLLVQPTTGRRGSLTGVGLSADNGRSFTDLTGLPNNNSNQQWFGDPTIVAVDDG